MVSEIYCYGGIDIYRDVFNAIAMLNGDRSFIQSLVTIGVIVGAFWSMVIMVGGDLVKPFLSWMLPMTIIQTVFLTPTQTVHLIDVVQAGRHETVDNVPYGLALMAGTLSRISHKLTEKTETFFTIPGDLKYSQTGGIFAANLLANQKIMTIQDEDFAENMRSFISQCVLYDLALGRKYTIKDLRNTNNIWGLVSANASPARSFLWKDYRARGDIITCQEGVTKFNLAWSGAIDQSACAVGASLYPNKDATPMPLLGGGVSVDGNVAGICRSPLAKQEFLRFLPIHYGAMATMSGNSGEVLKQQMMISAMVDAQDQASVMVGNASNYAARKAYLQQRSNYETIGKLASDTLPIMRAVLELICYSLFIFIMPLLVLPQGYKVLVSWSQTVLWLSMWPPMYAILHLIMVSAISMKTKAFIGISNPQGITLASSLGVQNISADMATMAGYLSMSIPFICIAVVKGISSFVHMSSSLGAVSQSVATGAATEALTGNHQLGNTSMDNHSFSNVNMLNEGYNSSLSSGSSRMQDGHVSITTSADGGMVANVEQSNTPISVNMADTIASNKKMMAAEAEHMGHSKLKSAETSINSSLENLGSIGKTLSNANNIDESWGETKQREIGTALQTVQSAVNKFAESNNISSAKAAQVMAQAGTPLSGLLGIGVSANASSSSEDQALIQKAKDFSESENLDKSVRIAETAMQHLSKQNTFSEATNALETYQGSLAKTARETESAQKHFEDSKTLTKEAEYAQSNSASINRNFNDKLLNYIADHKAPNVSGTIGAQAAARILAKNNEEALAYTRNFLRDHAPQEMLTFTKQSLEQDYESKNIAPVVNKDVVDTISKQASSHINHDLKGKASGIEGRFDSKVAEAEVKFAAAGARMNEQSSSMERKFDAEQSKIGLVEAAKQGVNAVLKTNNALAYGMKDAAIGGGRFVSDHADMLVAANPIMFAHPSLTQSSATVDTTQSQPEPTQKVIKITQVVKSNESEAIDLTNKKQSRGGE